MDWVTQHRFSTAGEAVLMRNVAPMVDETRARGGRLEVIVDPRSPYADSLVLHLLNDVGGEPGALQVGDGRVSRRRSFALIRVRGPSGPPPP